MKLYTHHLKVAAARQPSALINMFTSLVAGHPMLRTHLGLAEIDTHRKGYRRVPGIFTICDAARIDIGDIRPPLDTFFRN